MIGGFRHIVFVLSLLCNLALSAQQNYFPVLRTDSDSVLIANPVPLYLEVKVNKNDKVYFPNWQDTVKKNVEIIKSFPVDTIIDTDNAGMLALRKKFIVQIFDTGYVVIPPARIFINDSMYETNAALIKILTIPVDTTQTFKDIAPVVVVPYTWIDRLLEWLPYIITVILVILSAVFVYLWYKKKLKQKPQVIELKPSKSLEEEMLDLLQEIEEKKLWQSGFYKQFYSEVTDVLRMYIEKKYGINAMEMAGSEIIDYSERQGWDEKLKTIVRRVMHAATMVKYAKARPLPQECQLLINDIREFIEWHLPSTEQNIQPVNQTEHD